MADFGKLPTGHNHKLRLDSQKERSAFFLCDSNFCTLIGSLCCGLTTLISCCSFLSCHFHISCRYFHIDLCTVSHVIGQQKGTVALLETATDKLCSFLQVFHIFRADKYSCFVSEIYFRHSLVAAGSTIIRYIQILRKLTFSRTPDSLSNSYLSQRRL